MGVVRAYLRLAVGLVDEVILAHAIRTGRTTPGRRRMTGWCFMRRTQGRCWCNAAWLTLISLGAVGGWSSW